MRTVRPSEQGATYLFVMLAVVLLGISVAVAAQQWRSVVQREKEMDLLAKGIEIQTALAAYSAAMKKGRVIPGEVYPRTLDDLTKPQPFLRKAYADPMTGGEWEYLRDTAGGIRGVRSRSTATAFKEHDFPPEVRHFEGTTRYNQWVFEFPNPSLQTAPAAPQPAPPPANAPAPATPPGPPASPSAPRGP